MGRKKAVVVTGVAAVGAGVLARRSRRARAAAAAREIAETILPSAADATVARTAAPADPAHAPGHGHLDRHSILDEPAPPRVDERPFDKHHHGLRHPGRLETRRSSGD